jgi:nitrite reductase/ring-hydroxylating ferredoxin subunit
MAGFVKVGSSEEIAEGTAKAFPVEGDEIAVARANGTLYAFDDICTHRGCNLSMGEIEDTAIVCECHGSTFSMESGAVLEGPATEPIGTYPVREENGVIEIEA